MISKNNRQNSNFQILNFLVGSCHTPDAAYSLLCDLEEEREMALSRVQVSDMKLQAHIMKLEETINSPESKPYEVLEAQADLLEIKLSKKLTQRNIDAAQDELNFIQKCMVRLEPHRKYGHLPLPEAHQAMQQEEWKFELMRRAENFLLTDGHIPSDHFETMREHPEFKSELLPYIESTRACILNGVSLQSMQLLTNDLSTKLLEITDAS
jgi:hypothetical protein